MKKIDIKIRKLDVIGKLLNFIGFYLCEFFGLSMIQVAIISIIVASWIISVIRDQQ